MKHQFDLFGGGALFDHAPLFAVQPSAKPPKRNTFEAFAATVAAIKRTDAEIADTLAEEAIAEAEAEAERLEAGDDWHDDDENEWGELEDDDLEHDDDAPILPAPTREPFDREAWERADAARRAALIAAFPDADSYDFDGRPQLMTRAGLITMYNADAPRPFELTVRGIECVIAYHSGFQTYLIDKRPGALFWSETGFRSWAGCMITDPAAIAAEIEAHIARPVKDWGGCGGKLKRYWPSYVSTWQQSVAFALDMDRKTTWNQWGPEKHAKMWADHDAKLADAVIQMRADGINPDDVGPPHWHKGKWPVFAQASLF